MCLTKNQDLNSKLDLKYGFKPGVRGLNNRDQRFFKFEVFMIFVRQNGLVGYLSDLF